MRFGSALFLMLALVGILGCGAKGKNSSPVQATKASSVASYSILSGKSSTLKESNGTLSGTGVVLFSDPLTPQDQRRRFQVQFQLEVGGSLRLYLFASKTLAQGLELFVIRTATGLAGNLSSGGRDSDLSNRLTTIETQGDIRLTFDVENARQPAARFLLWKGATTDAASLLVDTTQTGHPLSPGKGQGTSWGVQLYKATLLDAQSLPGS